MAQDRCSWELPTSRRRFGRLLVGLLVAAPRVALAQQVGTQWRIGYIGNTGPAMNPAFEQAMRERGYIEGTNTVFERRFADGKDERYPALAADLVRLKVDLLVTLTAAATEAAMAATTTIPIVMTGVADPVRREIVASLARPGGNVTGMANLLVEMNSKRVELIKAAVPKAKRVAYLSNSGGWDPVKRAAILRELDAQAKDVGVTLVRIDVNAPSEFENVTAAIVREHPDALVLGPIPLMYRLRNEVAEFALKQRLPTIGVQRDQALAGILMTYGPNSDDMFRNAAIYVDKIFKGAKPADLPIQQPTKIELIINLKTAKALGLTIPQSVLLRAHERIE